MTAVLHQFSETGLQILLSAPLKERRLSEVVRIASPLGRQPTCMCSCNLSNWYYTLQQDLRSCIRFWPLNPPRAACLEGVLLGKSDATFPQNWEMQGAMRKSYSKQPIVQREVEAAVL